MLLVQEINRMKTIKQIAEGFFQTAGAGFDGKIAEIKERLKIVIKGYGYSTYRDTDELNEDYIKINGDLTVDILESRSNPNRVLILTPDKNGIGFQFGVVNVRSIKISECKDVETLHGLPKDFDGFLRIEHCPKLKTIDETGYGCNNLWVSNCGSLETIKGMPKKITGQIYLSQCDNISTLDGCAQTIGNSFMIRGNNSLKNLKGCPKMIGTDEEFVIEGCTQLVDIKDAPKNANRITLNRLPKLKSLTGLPSKVLTFECRKCSTLTSLEGAPQVVDRTFNCDDCTSLVTLEGGPEKTGYYFCNNTGITSLKGCTKVCRLLDCRENQSLSSIEGFPEEVNSDFRYWGCPNLKFKKADIESRVKGRISRAKKG